MKAYLNELLQRVAGLRGQALELEKALWGLVTSAKGAPITCTTLSGATGMAESARSLGLELAKLDGDVLAKLDEGEPVEGEDTDEVERLEQSASIAHPQPAQGCRYVVESPDLKNDAVYREWVMVRVALRWLDVVRRRFPDVGRPVVSVNGLVLTYGQLHKLRAALHKEELVEPTPETWAKLGITVPELKD